MNQYLTQLTCTYCGDAFPPTPVDQPWLTCTKCGSAEGVLELEYDLDAVRAAWKRKPLSGRALNHWRYAELLPLDERSIPSNWSVGWTPLIEVPRLTSALGLRQLLCKDEGRNPTASFKDRASSVGVADALHWKAETVACASTGNAATSLAGHAALAGLPAVIFLPSTAPEPKLAQMLIFGAQVVAVEGSYEAAYQLCTDACDRFGWYNRNCAMNPVLVEGKKTAGLEVAEQCAARGEFPDWIAVSVGDGCTITGIWKGLKEMHAVGVIERLPRMLGVQAAGVAPIGYALEHNHLPPKIDGKTLADSINVPVPRNWRRAIHAVRESDGQIVRVSDEQILAAMRSAGASGVFAEPAAAASIAGIEMAVSDGLLTPRDMVVAMITGSGLKDTRSAMRAGGEPIRIRPNLEALASALGL